MTVKFAQGFTKRLNQNRRLGRINANRQIVQRHFDHVAMHLAGVVHIVGQRLGIGQHDELTIRALVRHAIAQAADEVSQMEWSGRTVAGKNDWFEVAAAGGVHVIFRS